LAEAARLPGEIGVNFSPRVLHVIPSVSLKRGGPSEAIFPMVRALRNAGIPAEITTTNDDGPGTSDVPLHSIIEQEGVPIRYFPRASLPFRAGREYAFSEGFRPWLKIHLRDYDLVHVHALFSFVSSMTMTAARRMGVPYISRPLGQLGRWPLRQSAWRKKLYYAGWENRNLRHASALHFTSEEEKIETAGLGLLVRSAVIPHGLVVPPQLPDAKERLRAEMGLPAHEKIVLFLGRLHPKKGLDLLLPAFLAAQEPASTLLLAGDGDPSYLADLDVFIREHGASDKIIRTGFVSGERKQLLLQGADFFVLPSRHENFGLAVLEALAAGIPVLLSDHVALAREVEAHHLGVVVPLQTEALTAAMVRLLRQPRRPAEDFRDFVATHYSWSANAAALSELYSSILKPRP
jgi:glycosyltransferase involved in cell wall biosynthesis